MGTVGQWLLSIWGSGFSTSGSSRLRGARPGTSRPVPLDKLCYNGRMDKQMTPGGTGLLLCPNMDSGESGMSGQVVELGRTVSADGTHARVVLAIKLSGQSDALAKIGHGHAIYVIPHMGPKHLESALRTITTTRMHSEIRTATDSASFKVAVNRCSAKNPYSHRRPHYYVLRMVTVKA